MKVLFKDLYYSKGYERDVLKSFVVVYADEDNNEFSVITNHLSLDTDRVRKLLIAKMVENISSDDSICDFNATPIKSMNAAQFNAFIEETGKQINSAIININYVNYD